jgi:hypothetical protein
MKNLLDYFMVPVEKIYQVEAFVSRDCMLPHHILMYEQKHDGLPLVGRIGAVPIFDLTTQELVDERISYLEQENAYLRQCLEEANENL